MNGTALEPGARVAVIGTGISGLVAAHSLQQDFDLTLFEASHYVGGHTNTLDIEWMGERYAIDTGFIVFNDWTYPKFTALLESLGVESQPSPMSFSVQCPHTGVEYCGTNLDSIFAQRRNAIRPSFLWMLREILRFNKEALALLRSGDEPQTTLGEFLVQGRYSKRFVDHYVIPMGAAVWSARPSGMLDVPAQFFMQFFANHGFLSVGNRPTWRVVKGGSRQYVKQLTQPFADRILLNSPVKRVHRHDQGVSVELDSGQVLPFDGVVLATHSDTALAMLAKPSIAEEQILSAIPYQQNQAVLHIDDTVMPRARRAWAAWNYHIPTHPQDQVAVTYNMNILQGLDAPVQFCVTLNSNAKLANGKVLHRIDYQHPIFHQASIAAQHRRSEIQGRHHTWYCGAYWGFGFHEDGVKSGLDVASHLRGAPQLETS